MNEPKKQYSRQEIYEAVWQTPISKLAPAWNTTIAEIIKACDRMNIPRPSSGHWALVKHGWQVQRPPLPPAQTDTPTAAVVVEGKKRQKPVEPAEQVEVENRRKVEVPKDLRNAHRLVKQTHKALITDTYVHNGFVHTRSGLDHPLSVAVSAEQLERALRILDAIIKGVIALGGRFERGPEPWRLRLFVGKEPVGFHVREAIKRLDHPFTTEEREAPGFMWRNKYDWVGSGRLRFVIERDDYICERIWEDSKKLKLEEHVGEIIEALANIEAKAKQLRAEEEIRKNEEAKQRARADEEWRCREREKQNRERLEKAADEWSKAKRLRSFIRVCDQELRIEKGDFAPDAWQARWLGWARQHADRIDPIKRGFLESEKNRVRNPDDEENGWNEYDPDSDHD